MPLVGWACPPDKPTYGESYHPAHCILKCEHKCLSPNLIAALSHNEEQNHHHGLYISVTALSGCVRKLKLQRTVMYTDYMKNRMYGYRGTVIHQVAEDAATYPLMDGKTMEDLGFLSEFKMLIGFCFRHGGFQIPETVSAYDQETWGDLQCEQCKWEVGQGITGEHQNEVFLLGGTLDSAAPNWKTFDKETGHLLLDLWDLKTLGDYPLGKFIMGDDEATLHPNIKDDYIAQANLYKYLAELSPVPDKLASLGVKSMEFNIGNIQGFGMNHFPRSGSTYTYKSQKTGWKEKEFEIPSITFLDREWVESYIKERGYNVYQSLILDAERGDICEPESNKPNEHSWQCRFCSFHGDQEHCPNPQEEWSLLEKGWSKEEAFTMAQQKVA